MNQTPCVGRPLRERIAQRFGRRAGGALLASIGLTLLAAGQAQAAITCQRTITADVVAFDKPLMYNRLGAGNVNGMMYALKRDVINVSSQLPLTAGGVATPGQLDLRPDKRHRPLVLRVRKGDCLTVNLTNLLTVAPNPRHIPPNVTTPSGQIFNVQIDEQIQDRAVAFHASGVQLVDSIDSDGSWVGANTTDGFATAGGGTKVYRLFAEKEGVFNVTGSGTFGSDGNSGNVANGLFGQLIVEPTGAKIYRSQVQEEELRLVADVNRNGVLDAAEKTANGQPKIANYESVYPTTAPWSTEGKAGLPILNMMRCAGPTACEIVHSEINAIIAGPNTDGSFPAATYPLESVGKRNPTVPNRLEPFRDFASVYHDDQATVQAFPGYFVQDPVFRYVLAGVKDAFMINYGSGGIGSEIIANRLGVGPMHDCLNCAYEEFFLTSYTVGDPALTVDVPANLGLEAILPGQTPPPGTQGPKANYVIGAEDPSNVHHSYIGDFVKFRNTHIGKEQHVFHLHNHQWLYNPNDDNSNYLDAQGIGPGVGYTYEINFGGSGNRNKSTGDAIFHCHFYPHFAQGMWYHWRNNDTFESGTILNATPATLDAQGFATATGYHTSQWSLAQGKPKAGSRAYPDSEIVAGTPIPALVPLPGKPMPVMPGRVTTKANPLMAVTNPAKPVGSLAKVIDRNIHPGYPFFVAGIEDTVGQRPPTPVLDMVSKAQVTALKASGDPLWTEIVADQADGFDGGLPRHTLRGLAAGGEAHTVTTRLDFSKDVVKADAVFYPEEGTDLEKVAMFFHSQRCLPSFKPDGTLAPCTTDAIKGKTGGFVVNGSKPVVGAPYHNPCADDAGTVLKPGIVGRFFSGELASSTQASLNTRGASFFNSDAPRIYKGTNMQFDAVLNKVGYHYPQQRIVALWQDVKDIITKAKAPEPLVMRLNTFDCAVYHHSNLVPEYYEIDDFQVRTPTDIIGQHIHLPKWDLTTTDGAANGWNYEDGTLSPSTVRARIFAINCFNGYAADCRPGVTPGAANGKARLVPKEHPYWSKIATQLGGKFPEEWLGARTTTQKWFTDPVVNTEGVDRGLGIIFTHDHFGPSTHQQIGLYSTVLTEPAASRWAHNETGQQLGYDPFTGAPARTDTRIDGSTFSDGGPTSWQAQIRPQTQTGPYASNTVKAQGCTSATQVTGADCQMPFREFYFEYSDFQHAYEPGVYVGADQQGMPFNPDGAGLPPSVFNAGNPQWDGTAPNAFRFAINPPARAQINPVFPDLVVELKNTLNNPLDNFCPSRPCPQAIDVQDPGVLVVNYRQEPIALRVYDPRKLGPDGKPGMQADGSRGDLAFALQSRRDRALNKLNTMPDGNSVIFGTRFPPHINTGQLDGGDPFTPTMRVYNGDLVRVKMQAGAHEEEHNATIHGVKWLQAGSGHGSAKNSGWRNAQAGGISEQFTLTSPVLPVDNNRGNFADYAYSMDAGMDGWWSGMWGLMRAYENQRADLVKLPGTLSGPAVVGNGAAWNGVCPVGATPRSYDVSAVLANNVLPNAFGATIAPAGPVGTMHVGGPLNAAGGTLIYNRRNATVTGLGTDAITGARVNVSHQGPLHDPTAIMYVRTADLGPNGKLLATAPVEPLVLRALPGECVTVTLRNRLPGLRLAAAGGGFGGGIQNAGSAFETLSLIADTSVINSADGSGASINTGGLDGLDATGAALSPLSTSLMPDLATYTTIQGVVKRDRFNPEGSTTFNMNLIRPSGYAGLHPQLMAFDVTRHDGMPVGRNRANGQFAAPGGTTTYTWYAGDIGGQPSSGAVNLAGTPVEFGGSNLTAADKIKQGAKSMVGATVIEPAGTQWVENTLVMNRQDGVGTRQTRAQATVCPTGVACTPAATGAFRDFSLVLTKAMTHYYKDASPVEHMNGEGLGIPEDSQESSNMALNYGIEPMWFRFGILPQAPFGPATVAGSYASIANSHKAYSNQLLTGGAVTCDVNNICTGDPETPVFSATKGKQARIHITNPHGTTRGSTFAQHGHAWQRDPYICPGESRNGLTGACNMTSVGSRALGNNPLAFIQGGQESWNAVTHFDIVLPSAGGGNAIPGDYLTRDGASFGNASGVWSILRVK
jgi:manganese oxidase